ncbi:hypothetical protein TrRE_jg7130 [Triparma retinervis]|uniref:Uncharacterized protein n=1 Tax=Triparma retinervis TaxID=2557542 RepID=A0A9W7FCQ5_9STRA|nr:hypothetical protein TrRE_jg7130 [Triparma retinervis]
MATPRSQKRIQDAFSLARHNRYADLREMFEDEVNELHPDSVDEKGNSILLVACQNGLKRIARLAIKHGCNLDMQNGRGNTALHFCWMYGFGGTLGEYLKGKGADDSVRNHKRQTCYDVEMSPGGLSPSPIKKASSRLREMVVEEEEEQAEGGLEGGAQDWGYLGHESADDGGWGSEYVSHFVEGGYESQTAWGGGGDEMGGYYGNDDGFWGGEEVAGGGEGGEEHWTDEAGRQWCRRGGSETYWWDGETLQWLRWDGEEGGEGKEEEKWADSVINVEEEKEAGEDAAAAERDAKTGFKISNTKRRPPPKAKQRRRPPGLKIGGNEEKPRRRNPLKLKGTPKEVQQGTPVAGGGERGGEEKRGEEEKEGGAWGEKKIGESGSEEDDDAVTPQMYNDSAPLKMQVMECIASSNPSRLKSVLNSGEMRSSDVYPGVVNCVLKGVGGILSILLPHAGAQGRQSALVLAVRRANVDCAMRTLDAIIRHDGKGTWGAVERAVERAVGEVDDEGMGLGRRILLRTMEQGKARAEEQVNMDWKRILLKLATKGARAAVDMVTALMEEHDTQGRLKIYNSVAVKAIFKKRVEALPSLLKLMGSNNRNISALLSQCAARNEVKGCQAVLATGAIGKDALGRAIDVAKGKGADDALAVLKAYGG